MCSFVSQPRGLRSRTNNNLYRIQIFGVNHQTQGGGREQLSPQEGVRTLEFGEQNKSTSDSVQKVTKLQFKSSLSFFAFHFIMVRMRVYFLFFYFKLWLFYKES